MFSALNPEAPEFYPHFTAVTQDGFKAVGQSIQISNSLPSGASYNKFTTFTNFKIISCTLSQNILEQSNKILATESQIITLKSNNNDHNIEKVVDANDNILDRANTNIDIASGLKKPLDPSITGLKNPVNHVSSWNASPVIAKIKMGSATLIGAKNIPRPQINFKEPIDNSDSLWVPRISDKPNSIKPLALNILYNDNGEAVGYEHPYKVELDLYHPKANMIDRSTEPPIFPLSLEETTFTYIDTEEELDKLVNHLQQVSEIAVDVEHHSYRTYQGITCLIQLSTDEGGDFIIDTLALREHIYKLNVAFTDPKKLKVFHGAEMDIMWLQRDFGVYVVGLFDTHQAAKVLKLTGLSLKNLLMRYCQIDADKKYQLADWRMRPLPEELIAYARVDTHYLLYMWRRMRDDLLDIASGQPHLLLSVFEQSRLICGLTYNKEVLHETSHIPLYLKSKKSFNSRQMSALKLLYKWRDMQARELDESTSYLLPNHMLLALAETLPRELQGVNAVCSPMPPFVKQNLITIHRMILTCRELPLEPQLYQMPQSISTMVNHQRAATYCFHDLSQFPDFRDDLPNALNKDDTQHYDTDDRTFSADVKVFVTVHNSSDYVSIVSELNAEAKSFIPPFERYKKYRSLAQIEEIKEFKEKEAKIVALGKDDELIKKELLSKFKDVIPTPLVAHILKEDAEVTTQSKVAQRKRKISTENLKKEPAETPQVDKTIKKPDKQPNTAIKNQVKNEIVSKETLVKPFDYANTNYKKFYDESQKFEQKFAQNPKIGYKKHKK